MRSMLSLEEYLSGHHGGDISRVTVRKLDFSIVRTIPEFLQWALPAFGVPSEQQAQVDQTDAPQVLQLVWDAVPRNKRSFIVLCSYPRHRTSEILPLFDEWQHTLGWGLSRDYCIQVVFVQDPETKGRRPPTKDSTVPSEGAPSDVQ